MDMKGINKRIMERAWSRRGHWTRWSPAAVRCSPGWTASWVSPTRRPGAGKAARHYVRPLRRRSVDAPLPELQLPAAADASKQEKGVWEHELMGVTFSETPFAQMLAGVDPGAAIISVQDLEGIPSNRPVVPCRAGGIRPLLHHPTVAPLQFPAQLGLLGGATEVVAFGTAYTDNQELWREGKPLAGGWTYANTWRSAVGKL